MDVLRLFDAPEFLDEATPLLLADEARHNLMLGIAGTVRDQPGRYDEFRAWLVEHRGAVVAAALQTPPFNLVLARPADDDAIGALADAVAGDGIDLPGVVGAIPEVDAFAEAWEARRRTTRVLRTSQRIYRLTELRPPTDVAGNARVATAEDLPLLIDWIDAFVR